MTKGLKKHFKKILYLVLITGLLIGGVFLYEADMDARKDIRGGVVCLMPDITEILFEIGVDNISAVCEQCTYPRRTKRIKKISPAEVKAIYDMDPYAVYIGEGMTKLEDILDGLDIPTVIIPEPKNLNDIMFNIKIVGLYEEKDTAYLLESLQSAAGEKPQRKLKAFVLTDINLQTAGGLSFISDLIEYAGAENIFKDIPQVSFDVSMQDVLDRKPDVIISLQRSSGGNISLPEELSKFKHIKLKADIFGQPSPRAVRSIPFLRADIEKLKT
jgi:ABC-type Fe3+-hydroxamate transport system substrate-binding protein